MSKSLSLTATQSISETMSKSLSATASETPTLSLTATESISISRSQSISKSATISVSQSISETATRTQTASESLTASISRSSSASISETRSPSITASETRSITLSATVSPSETSQSVSPTVTLTATSSPSPTASPQSGGGGGASTTSTMVIGLSVGAATVAGSFMLAWCLFTYRMGRKSKNSVAPAPRIASAQELSHSDSSSGRLPIATPVVLAPSLMSPTSGPTLLSLANSERHPPYVRNLSVQLAKVCDSAQGAVTLEQVLEMVENNVNNRPDVNILKGSPYSNVRDALMHTIREESNFNTSLSRRLRLL
eukprot:c7285_g2_i1.p1 GENE.c7285_g2_i1~~c7285_g2_i1.p1  ORF type:complete len:327 (+),score=74.36 c7285_g2_i1:47-982(+)